MNISEKISIIRKARGYTQEELGEKVGVSRQTVSSWEKDDFEPTLDSIRALSVVLDVSFDTLLNERIDLSDKQELNVSLKNLDSDTKGKINNSFRYRIRQYTITKKDYARVISYFTALLILSVALIVNSFFVQKNEVFMIIEIVLVSLLAFVLCVIYIPISDIKRIRLGGSNYSFGTLSQTHLVIIGWSDSKFDRTIYVPVSEIEKMELGNGATLKHGKVIITIKGRNKPMVTNDIVEPQKLIDIFNNLDTFVESPYGE